MHLRDKIIKASWTVFQMSKDVTSTNIINAVKSKQLKIESSELEKLLSVISASADEGYHKGIRSLEKVVDSSLDEASNSAFSMSTDMSMLDKKK